LLRVELRYRPEQSSTVAKRDAEFLEVAVGKIGEHVDIDLTFSKLFLVSTEAETAEPHADIHDRALAGSNPRPLVDLGIGVHPRMKQAALQG
jgi:hypothetical protein